MVFELAVNLLSSVIVRYGSWVALVFAVQNAARHVESVGTRVSDGPLGPFRPGTRALQYGIKQLSEAYNNWNYTILWLPRSQQTKIVLSLLRIIHYPDIKHRDVDNDGKCSTAKGRTTQPELPTVTVLSAGEQTVNGKTPIRVCELQKVVTECVSLRKKSRFILKGSTIHSPEICIAVQKINKTYIIDSEGIHRALCWLVSPKSPPTPCQHLAFSSLRPFGLQSLTVPAEGAVA